MNEQAHLLLSSGRLVEAAKEYPDVEVVNLSHAVGDGAVREEWDSGEFVQFSSGSTADPKGVRLSLDAMGSNVEQLHQALPQDPFVCCSWMPLSHDMGLMLALSSWARTEALPAREGGIRLMEPMEFMRSPTTWLRECSDAGATLVGLSNSAMEMVARRTRSRASLSLESITACIVGSEPLSAATICRFVAALKPFGFREAAICPAYGLAEATVAVTMTPMDVLWHRADLPAEVYAGGSDVVALGPPLPRTDIRISGDRLGAIEIRGPSLLTGYVGAAQAPFTKDNWFRTSDIGAMVADELVVLARSDDVVFSAGQKLYATDMERVLSELTCFDARHIAVVPFDGRYAVVTEVPRSGQHDADTLFKQARNELLQVFGSAPVSLVLVPRGGILRTPTGKLQRDRTASALGNGELEVIATASIAG